MHTVNLALQGGGSHGAFTWGALDRLLEEPRLDFEGLSGSSAGAMNAVVMADGWKKGGRKGAREGLAAFWTAVSRQMPWAAMTQGEGEAISLSPASKLMAKWAGSFAPSQLNPWELNPLRGLLLRQVDFAGLRRHSPFKLFVGATAARTGRLRIFREHELTAEMVLASACLPRIHHAVEIEGEPFWDGGYAANPAVFPLFYDCDSSDVLLVLLSPLEREGTPRTKEEIDMRIVELGFSAAFMREMRMFTQAIDEARSGLLRAGRLERRLARTRFHMIDSTGLAALERTETQLLAPEAFLEMLRGQGRERASAWLDEHAGSIGRRSTVDLHRWFG